MSSLSRLALAFLAAASAEAATIAQRDVVLEVLDRQLDELTRLEVIVDDPGDAESWSVYPILLDDDIELVSCSFKVEAPDGKVTSVPRRTLRKETSVGFGLYTSAYALIADLPPLHLGDRITIEVVRRFDLAYPSFAVRLARTESQRRLSVTVQGPGAHLTWKLSGWSDLLRVEAADDRLSAWGDDLPGDRKRALEPKGDAWQPTLWLNWASDPTWTSVAGWYADLVGSMEVDRTAVSALAEEITRGLDDPRDKLEALAAHVKGTIRYEAVAIGRGGYLPSPPETVIGRGWGDCKDVARLLVDLLAAVGVPARMALVRGGRDGRVDPDFPSPLGFNHVVVAVVADAIGMSGCEACVDGLLLVDATLDRGPPLWLSPFIQGASALVVDRSTTGLDAIPVLTGSEVESLVVTGAIGRGGQLEGRAELSLSGERALPWLRAFDSLEPARIEQAARETFQRRIPGALLDNASCESVGSEVPSVVLSADLRIPHLVHQTAGHVRMRPPLLSGLPDSRVVDGRSRPVVLPPGTTRSSWRIELAGSWQPVDKTDLRLDNTAGSLSHRVWTAPDGAILIERELRLDRWWFGEELFDDLRQLSLAESRGARKSVRLRAQDPGDDAER